MTRQLDPETTAEDLQGHFVGCGGIQYVNIRYSSSGVPGHPQHGYRYAIVKFETAEAADAAVALNGSNLMGSDYSLVVRRVYILLISSNIHVQS
jgi:hypothetical protein